MQYWWQVVGQREGSVWLCTGVKKEAFGDDREGCGGWDVDGGTVWIIAVKGIVLQTKYRCFTTTTITSVFGITTVKYCS